MKRLLARPASAVVAMLAVVTAGGLMPALRTSRFYYWDDTQAAAVGVWQEIPEQLMAGNIPFLLIDMWRGGNFAAEAATGLWNPILVGLMFLIRPFDDLAVAMTLAKILLMLICAGGVYLLARSYGASVWPAAIAGAAMPLSGWQLFVDGTSWINGTTMTAFTPWAWWALRRAAIRGFPPSGVVLAVVAGYLLMATGNPFTAVLMIAIYIAVLIEMVGGSRRRDVSRWTSVAWLAVVGLATLLLAVVVYLPFTGTSAVGNRADPELLNTEFLTANLSHFMGMSASSYLPWINGFNGPLHAPAAYLAWFVVPLLPWLRFDRLRRWGVAGLLFFGVAFALFVMGPSQMWSFRWPVRMIPFAYLPVIIAFAVALSDGLRRDHRTQRLIASGALIALGAWLAMSDDPGPWKWHGLTTVLIVGLVLMALAVRSGPRLFLVTSLGGLVLLGAQLMVSPTFANHPDYGVPTSREDMVDSFDGRYVGNTLQIMKLKGLRTSPDWNPDGAWRDFSIGNLYAVADIASPTAYSGIGFTAFDRELCIAYNGQVCADAWEEVFDERADGPPLADQLRLETIVLQRLLDEHDAPAGWEIAETTEFATVYRRVDPLALPGSTVGAVGVGITVPESTRDGLTTERTRFESAGTGDRSVTYARLAWPGYRATADGQELSIETTDAGLLRVEIPDDIDAGTIELTFTPPGLSAGLGAMGAGLVLTAGLAVVSWRRGKRQEESRILHAESGQAT